ncbi:phosphoglycerate dehydrogenase [Frisingicoccus sp.]|uniref:phosphoglycerate dehydrogenase n=1 Tax=Frisingicoccus sp. TaxID=1918627 RepID=UPI002A7FBF7C|nr:phosphoglycerate dehydrogenase [Frisingicoccus sp.]MDY4835618.1 phosphoglycerate dehydrogenase [Frisingicoccus sp.]MDY4921418.1 phosphoglycerate dehydrogenase [Frisingicoccus sp.]MDY5955876.1 phosphoglycerate dehydrogenase [Frisingicoccus sp.]
MYKVKCLNPIAKVGMDVFSDAYEKTEEFAEAEVAMVRSAAMHDMDLPEGLLTVARAGAGVNNIPLEKCAEKGIVVFNTPGANANGVKEAVLAGMFLAARDIVGGINWVQSEKTDPAIDKLVEKKKSQFAGTEIKGKKLGVIGLGAIGVRVANACNRLGMEVYGYDPFISVDAAWSLSRDIKHINNLDDIYANCDFISVHVPLMDDTRKMINEEAIAKMKDGVIILNFARDLLVDDDAMEKALASGKVRRYVTDFPNARTAQMAGVIAIPHLGASTEESEDNCAVMAAKQVRDYVENGNIKNSVNYPACDMGVCKAEGRVAICHRNIPKILSKLTNVCAEEGLNIEDMTNKSKGAWAYTMIDMNVSASDEVLNALKAVEGVVKVRKIK